MSNRAPAWFETKYVDGVTHKIQSQGNLLANTSRPPDRENGLTVVWKVSGVGEATQRSAAADEVSVMNLDRGNVSATMQDWEANDYIDLYDLTKMSENEQAETQKSGAMAIGRRKDRIQLGALDLAAGAINTVGNGTTAISPLDVMTAQGNIADIGVGSYEYFCALPQILMQQLELYREFSSSDYIGDERPLLKQVSARRWRGIVFIPVPSAYLNVPSANQIDAYLWVRESIGTATAMDFRSRIDWVPTKKKWLAANDISSCAALILPEGVQRLRFATNIGLSRPTP